MSKRKREDGSEVKHAFELICCRNPQPDEIDGYSLTPLEKQVVELKESIPPNTILMVACGYRVKFYGRDSQVASRRCGIMCIPGQPFHYSSIPYTRVDLYVHRLVSMGYHVAFADQESAAVRAVENNKTGIFKRTISQLYSKATLLPNEQVKTIGGGNPGVTIDSSKRKDVAGDEDDSEDGNQVDADVNASGAAEDHSDLFICFFRAKRANWESLDLILVSFVTQEVKRESVSSALQLEDVLQQFDIAEIVILRTSALNSLQEPFQDFPHDYLSVLNSTLALQMGPTENGEEDGKTVSVSTFVTLQSESIDECVKAYLKSYKLDTVYIALLDEGITSGNKVDLRTTDSLHLPGSTLRSLDVISSTAGRKGSLCSLLDRCLTVCGSRRLRKWILAPLSNRENILQRQECVRFLLNGQENGSVEELLREAARVGDVEATLGKLQAKRCTVSEYIRVLKMIRNVNLLAKNMIKDVAKCPGLHTLVEACCGSVIQSFITSHAAELNSAATTPLELFSTPEATPPASLVLHSHSRQEALKALELELGRIREVLKLPSLDYRTVNGTPYVIDVPSSKATKAEKSWVILSRTKTNVRYHTPTIIEQNTALCAARDRLVVASNEAWDAMQESIAAEAVAQGGISKLIDAIASLDALRSLSLISSRPGYVCPVIRPYVKESGDQLLLKGARHPVIETLLPEGYVACDVEMPLAGTWLLTGPNMGGKSALMRMIGLFVVLAQMGCYVPAVEACLPVFKGVYCRMGASDSILEGSSTFLSEMNETSRILDAENLSQSLVLMDELGRGTSSFDGAAVAAATLEYLAKVGSTNIFVTHYNYLCDPYRDDPLSTTQCFYMGFTRKCVEEDRADGLNADNEHQLVFTYQPCKGVTPSSFGIDVAMYAGLPSTVTSKAKQISAQIEKDLDFQVSLQKVKAIYRQKE